MKRGFINSFLVLFFLIISFQATAQEWENTFGTTEQDYVNEVVEAPNGDFVFTGIGNDRAVAFGVSAAGDSLWSNFNLSAQPRSEGKAIINTGDGGYALVGSSFDLDAASNFVLLVKLNTSGDILWSNNFSFQQPNPQVNDVGFDLRQTPDGGYLVTGTAEQQIGLLKTDGTGNILWNNYYGASDLSPDAVSLITLDNGNYGIVGSGVVPDDEFSRNIFLLQVDPDGNQLDYDVYLLNSTTVNDVILTDDGGFLFVCDNALHKLNSAGDLEGTIPDYITAADQEMTAAAKHPSGNILVAGPMITGVPVRFSVMDQQGNMLSTNIIETTNPTIKWVKNIITTSDGGYLISGEGFVSGEFGTLKRQFWLKKQGSLTELYTNNLRGTIYFDENQNCAFDDGETTLSGEILQAEGAENFYGISSFNGHYSMLTDTGDYTLRVIPSAGPYWAPCPDSVNVSFPNPNDTLTQDFGLGAVVDCPYMTVDLSAPFLRRCFESTYTVKYCNYGTITAEEAFIEVALDSFLSLVSSSIPITNQQGNTYTFDLGDVPINTCGQFQIEVFVSCDAELGQTHCSEAHVYPDSLCLPTAWAGPVINLEAECIGDSIEFLIINDGETMQTPQEYIVTEDNIILMQESFQLNNGQEQRFTVYANGSTYRLEAEQAPGYPEELGNTSASVSVEGCNGFSQGFVVLFPEDDGAPYLSIDCQENIGAYDPNDKRAFPAGYDAPHYIARNTDLEYHIRFQNTGTDTAFTVVIRETLDTDLDVTSVRPGAASHPYEFDISGNGILTFTFNNIMLPDSNINEPASHGFVKFSIAQKPDLELGTVITNSAGIYFDFNLPVITNQTWHTIGENFVEVVDIDDVLNPAVKTTVAPNPFTTETLLQIEGITVTKGTLQLFNAQGQLVHTQAFSGQQIRLNAQQLRKGLYVFRVESEGQLLSSGKVVVQ